MAYQKCSSLFLLPKLENSVIFSSECLPGTAEASMLVQRAGRQGRRTTVHFLAILIFNIMLHYFKFGLERISNAFACFMHASFSTTKV